MTIPIEWLRGRISFSEVEAELAEVGASDLWLCSWRTMVDGMAPGDQLWDFEGVTESDHDLDGFAVVRGSEIVDWIEIPDSMA